MRTKAECQVIPFGNSQMKWTLFKGKSFLQEGFLFYGPDLFIETVKEKYIESIGIDIDNITWIDRLQAYFLDRFPPFNEDEPPVVTSYEDPAGDVRGDLLGGELRDSKLDRIGMFYAGGDRNICTIALY